MIGNMRFEAENEIVLPHTAADVFSVLERPAAWPEIPGLKITNHPEALYEGAEVSGVLSINGTPVVCPYSSEVVKFAQKELIVIEGASKLGKSVMAFELEEQREGSLLTCTFEAEVSKLFRSIKGKAKSNFNANSDSFARNLPEAIGRALVAQSKRAA